MAERTNPAVSIVVSALFLRTTLFDSPLPASEPPYRLDDFEILFGWEGQVGTSSRYRLWGASGLTSQYDARVYFGRPGPTSKQLERAQAELDRLQMPDWPSLS